MKEQQDEKSKMKSMASYEAITYHFQSTTPYKKDDTQQLRFKEELLPSNHSPDKNELL
jgi:hypothetical protein